MYRCLEKITENEVFNGSEPRPGDDHNELTPVCGESILQQTLRKSLPNLSCVPATEEEMFTGFFSCITQNACRVYPSVPKPHFISSLQSVERSYPDKKGELWS